MNTPRLIVLEKFGSEAEAQSAQAWLEQVGIKSFLEGSMSSATLTNFGLGAVKLVVPESSLQAAKAALQQYREQTFDGETWYCEQCHETNEASFDICWNCQRSRADVASAVPIHGVIIPPGRQAGESVELQGDSGNPYQPVTSTLTTTEDEGTSKDCAEDLIQRGFRSAMLGISLPFLFTPYSIMLLLNSYDINVGISKRSLRNRRIAWATNGLTLAAWSLVLLRLLRQ